MFGAEAEGEQSPGSLWPEAQLLKKLQDAPNDPKARARLARERGAKTLIDCLMICDDDDSSTSLVLTTITALARMGPDARAAVASAGAVQSIVPFLGYDSLQVQLDATAAIESLALMPDVQAEAIQSGAIPYLQSSLASASSPLRCASAAVVKALASSSESRQALVSAGTIPHLVSMLRADGAGAQEEQTQASGALQNIAFDQPAHKIAISDAGGVAPLLAILGGSGSGAVANALRSGAARALQCISDNQIEVACDVVDAGGVEVLVNLLLQSTDVVQESVLGAMVALAFEAATGAATRIAQVGGIELMVKFLHAQEGSALSQLRAATILRDLATASKKYSNTIRAAGAIDLLVSLFDAESQIVQEAAVQALLGLARHSEHHAAIVKSGAFGPLVEQLSLGTSNSGEAAAELLRRLAAHTAMHLPIVEAITCPTLLALARRNWSPVEREVSFIILEGVTSDHQNYRDEIMSHQGISFIAKQLSTATGKELSATVGLLRNLCKGGAAFQEKVFASGVLPTLVALLHGSSNSVRSKAADLLLKLAKDRPHVRLAAASGGALGPLAELLTGEEAKAQIVALRALGELAKERKCRLPIAETGACDATVSILTGEPDEEHQRAAVMLLHQLSSEQGTLPFVASSGVIPALVTILENGPDAVVAERLASLLQRLSLEPTTTQLVVEAGCVPPLVRLLQSGTPSHQRSAAITLSKLVYAPATHPHFMSSGALPVLREVLQMQEDSLWPHCLAIVRELSFVADYRSAILEEQFFPILISLLASPDPSIQEPSAATMLLIADNDQSVQGFLSGDTLHTVVHALDLYGPSTVATLRLCVSACLRLSQLSPRLKLAIVEAGGPAYLVSIASGQDSIASSLPCTDDAPEAEQESEQPALRKSRTAPDVETQELAVFVLQSLSLSAEHAPALLEAGTIQYATSVLKETSDPKIRKSLWGTLQNLATHRPSLEAMVTLGMVPLFKHALSFPRGWAANDGSGTFEAALTLTRNSSLVESLRPALIEGGLVELLVDIASINEKPTNQLYAAQALKELSASSETQCLLEASGGISGLISLLGRGDDDVCSDLDYRARSPSRGRYTCSTTTGSSWFTSPDGDRQDDFLDDSVFRLQRRGKEVWASPSKAPPEVRDGDEDSTFPLTKSEQQSLLDEAVVGAIWHLSLADGGVYNAAILSAGAIPKIVSTLTNSRNLPLKSVCAGALLNLGYDSTQTKASIADAGALAALVQILSETSSAAKAGNDEVTRLRSFCVVLLKSLARLRECREELVDVGGVPVLLQTLRDEPLQEDIIWIIHNLTYDDECYKGVVHASNGIPTIIALLKSKNKAIVKSALGALQNLASSPKLRSVLGQHKGIAALSSLLISPDIEIVENAIQVLCAAVVECVANKLLARDAGILPKLVKLLSSDRRPSQTASALLLQSLSEETQVQDALRDGGCIVPLVKLLSSESETLQEIAAATLRNLAATNKRNRMMVVEAGGIAYFVKMLASSEKELVEDACGALQSLACDNDKNKQTIATLGGIEALANLLETGSPGVQLYAAGTLQSLATLAQNQELIANSGAIAHLLTQLSSGTALLQERAAGVVQNLLSHHDCRWQVVKAGALPLLLSILEADSDPKSTSHAAAALRNLAFEDDEGVVAVVEAGALPPLVALVSRGLPSEDTPQLEARLKALENAVAALVNVAILDYCKLALAKLGVIDVLAKCEAVGMTTAGGPRAATYDSKVAQMTLESIRKFATATLQSLSLEEFNVESISKARMKYQPPPPPEPEPEQQEEEEVVEEEAVGGAESRRAEASQTPLKV